MLVSPVLLTTASIRSLNKHMSRFKDEVLNKQVVTSVWLLPLQNFPAQDFLNLHAPSLFPSFLPSTPSYFSLLPLLQPLIRLPPPSHSKSACLLTLSLANPYFLSPSPSLIQTNSLQPLSLLPPHLSPDSLSNSPSLTHTDTHTSLSLPLLSLQTRSSTTKPGVWVPMRAVRAISAFHTLWCS